MPTLRTAVALLVGGLALAAVPASGEASTHHDQPQRPACPSNMALVGSSCVDKFEASLVEVQDDGTETVFSPYASPIGHHVRAVSRPGVIPQAHMSMIESKRACKASGKRLCKAPEWKTACKGPEATRFPYGEERVANACVDTNRTSPMTLLHQGEHTARTLNDPLANQQEGTVEATGAAASCTNGFGVHDMVGNLHEWTDDASFRGGYYLDTTLNGEGCEYRTVRHAAVYYDYSIGFRCCADANSLDEDEAMQSTDSEAHELAAIHAHSRYSEPTQYAATEPRITKRANLILAAATETR